MDSGFPLGAACGSFPWPPMDHWWGPCELGVAAGVSSCRDEAIGGGDLVSFVVCRSSHSSLSQCEWCCRVVRDVEVG